MTFRKKVLDSIAKKIDSILNRPFESKYISGLFGLGSLLIVGSTIYGFTTKGKAEIKGEGYNVILDFASGPELLPTIVGAILIGLSFAGFWKTKISVHSKGDKTEFDRMVEEGLENVENYLVEKYFKQDFGFIMKASVIRLIADMDDSYNKYLDYGKGGRHLEVKGRKFEFISPKKTQVTELFSTFFYFLFAVISVGSLQATIWSFKLGSFELPMIFAVFAFCMAIVSYGCLTNTWSISAARRLVKTTA
ncbi:hypothetical protein [Vibrio parahaemolyticus]|uniref:hypothetical protein n=1 Tax=Vibrio parahaemolyticus TaxID=670 RepID=UPI0023615B6F|nr:hypothetical protein [Vibrio parahaemolyticus]